MSTEEFGYLLMYFLGSGGKFEFEIELKVKFGLNWRVFEVFLKRCLGKVVITLKAMAFLNLSTKNSNCGCKLYTLRSLLNEQLA